MFRRRFDLLKHDVWCTSGSTLSLQTHYFCKLFLYCFFHGEKRFGYKGISRASLKQHRRRRVIRRSAPITYYRRTKAVRYNHKRGRRGAGGCGPSKLGRNPFHSGKFSKRTIGNLGDFSACSQVLFDISGRKFTDP